MNGCMSWVSFMPILHGAFSWSTINNATTLLLRRIMKVSAWAWIMKKLEVALLDNKMEGVTYMSVSAPQSGSLPRYEMVPSLSAKRKHRQCRY